MAPGQYMHNTDNNLRQRDLDPKGPGNKETKPDARQNHQKDTNDTRLNTERSAIHRDRAAGCANYSRIKTAEHESTAEQRQIGDDEQNTTKP